MIPPAQVTFVINAFTARGTSTHVTVIGLKKVAEYLELGEIDGNLRLWVRRPETVRYNECWMSG